MSKQSIIDTLFSLCEKGTSLHDFQTLLKTHANEDLLLKTNDDGWTPLMVVVFNGYISFIEEIMKATEATLESTRIKYLIDHRSHSGSTALDLAYSKKNDEIIELITKESQRQKRLNDLPTKIGYHQTDEQGFNYIIADKYNNRYPMIGGAGGFFGGGIYFAVSPEEANAKALYLGYGFRCELKMGNCCEIRNENELYEFRDKYCFGQEHYSTPVDVMRERLLKDNYDSVWGIQDTTIDDVSKRILRSGDEYVLYSADQIDIQKMYLVKDEETFNQNYIYYYILIKPLSYSFKKGFQQKSKQPHTDSLKWIEITQRKPNQHKVIMPTRSAQYYKIPDDIMGKKPLTKPWPIEKTKDVLKNHPFELQSGDIIDFSHKKDDYHCMRCCVYLKYKDGFEMLLPFLSKNHEYMNTMMVNIEHLTGAIFINQKILIEYLQFDSVQSFLSHYKSILTTNPKKFLCYETELLTEPELTSLLPILGKPRNFYYSSALSRASYIVTDGMFRYLLIQEFAPKIPIVSLGSGKSLTETDQEDILNKLIPMDRYTIDIKINIVIVFEGFRYFFVNTVCDESYIKMILTRGMPTLDYDESQSTPTNVVFKDVVERDMNNLITKIKYTPSKYKSLPIFFEESIQAKRLECKKEKVDNNGKNSFFFEFIIVEKNTTKGNSSITKNLSHTLYNYHQLKNIFEIKMDDITKFTTSVIYGAQERFDIYPDEIHFEYSKEKRDDRLTIKHIHKQLDTLMENVNKTGILSLPIFTN